MSAKVYGHTVALIIHAAIIIVLSIAVVHVPAYTEAVIIPEPPVIKIGEQEVTPPEASLVEPETESLPPTGVDTPMEEELDEPITPHPEAMLEVEEEPLPEDITKLAHKGILDEPRREVDPADPLNKLRGPDSSGVPEMFGQPIDGDTVFLVDLSGSMGDKYGDITRFKAVLGELTNAIQSLREEDSFDIVAYSGYYSEMDHYTNSLWGKLYSATESNKIAAIEWLSRLSPDGGTPTYDALFHVYMTYPSSVENLILVTDGLPNTGTDTAIIGSISRWLSKFTDIDFICISISSDGLPFVKRLVDRAGGAYVLVD